MMTISRQENNRLNKVHRVESPENTLIRLKQGLHNLGLEEEVVFRKSTGLLTSARLLIPKLKAISNGKGVSKLEAEVSAYAEIVERISAGLEPGIDLTPHLQLPDHQSKRLQEFVAYKYIDGYSWDHQDSKKFVIGAESLLRNETFEKEDFEFFKMKSELLRHWIPGESLVNKKKVFIPPMFVRWISSTNGIAAGNTVNEATLHACYEIFERFALISFLRDDTYKADTIDNASIESETIQELIKFFEDNGFDVLIKDLSFSGLFPVYAVIFTNKNIPSNYLMYNTIKAGASFDSETAIIRCFTERLQGTDLEFESRNTTERHKFIQNDEDDYLCLFFKGLCPVNLDNRHDGEVVPFIDREESDLDTCINKCIGISKSMKTDLVVVTHIHPILLFPTVRVIMPGLSDFIKWWNPKKITRDFIGKYNQNEIDYQDTLFRVMTSFFSIKQQKVY